MEPSAGLTPPAAPLREFVCHAYTQRRGAAAVFGAVLGLFLLAAALLTPSYRATATLAVLPSPEFTVRAAAGSHDANASALALDQIMKTETEILGSDDLHSATLHKIGPSLVYPDVFDPAARGMVRSVLHGLAGVVLAPWRVTPRDEQAVREEQGLRRFAANLSVLPAKDANVITLTFDNRNAERAATTLNTLLGLYAARRSRLYDDPQLELVRHEAEAAGRAVAATDQALAAFKRDHAISDYDQERGLLLHRASETEQHLAEASAAASEYQARLSALGRVLQEEPPTIGFYQENDPDARLLAVNAGLQDLRAKLAAAGDKYKDTSRVVTGLRAQIASHEAERDRLLHDAAASVVRRGRNPSLDPLHLDHARASAELAAAQAREAAGQQQQRAIASLLARLDGDEAGLAALQRQKASAEQDYRETSRILAERRLSEAEDSRRLANVRVIQPALMPQMPRAIPLMLAAAGFVLGLVAAAGWLVARFVLRPVFLTAEGLEAATGLPVLAVFNRTAGETHEDFLVA